MTDDTDPDDTDEQDVELRGRPADGDVEFTDVPDSLEALNDDTDEDDEQDVDAGGDDADE